MNLEDINKAESGPIIMGNKENKITQIAVNKIINSNFKYCQVVCIDNIHELEKTEIVVEPVDLFSSPFLLTTIDHSMTMYDPYVHKKGKNSWKQNYKYHN